MTMQIAFPFAIDGQGFTASTGYDDHIRQLIEQLLFTNPGERVNRPDFGAGVIQLIFAPNSVELAAATQALIQGALHRWLSQLIDVDSVRVDSNDSTLTIQIAYTVRLTRQRRVDTFQRQLP